MKNKLIYNIKMKKGFTLVELMVSLTIFILVMTIVMGSILRILDINTKFETKKTAMDNMNFSLESMSRVIRFSTKYHCGTSQPLTSPADCPSGNNSLTVTDSSGRLVTYALSGNAITRTINGGTADIVTSPEIVITGVTFWVLGSYPHDPAGVCPESNPSDCNQPRVVIKISGTSGTSAKTQSSFVLQTTVSQRKFDI